MFRSLLAGLLLAITSCNKDIEDVRLEGYVYDEASRRPIGGVSLDLVNWYYEGGDYDSYNKWTKHSLTTNESGFYSVTLRKSAFVEFDIKKNGYSKSHQGKDIYKKKVRLDFYLKKE